MKIGVLVAIIAVFFFTFILAEGQEIFFSDNVRYLASVWSNDGIDDTMFVKSIRYYIDNGEIIIPDLNIPTDSAATGIPDWVKNNSGWWADGLISDSDFANGLQFLAQNRLIPAELEPGFEPFKIPPPPIIPNLRISDPELVYHTGDKLRLSGVIDKPGSSEIVNLKVYSPSGKIIITDQIKTLRYGEGNINAGQDGSRNFFTDYYLVGGTDWINGKYKIEVTYENDKATKEFQFEEDNSINVGVYDLTIDDFGIFAIEYAISGGNFDQIDLITEEKKIEISIIQFEEGILILKIPRQVLDAKVCASCKSSVSSPYFDEKFIVTVNSYTTKIQEFFSPDSRIIQLSLIEGDSMIEIIGTDVIGTPPSNPTTPFASPIKDGESELSWDKSVGHGVDIIDYVIEIREFPEGSFSEYDDGVSNLPQTIVTGLKGYQNYEFRISAVSSLGVSEYSEPFSSGPVLRSDQRHTAALDSTLRNIIQGNSKSLNSLQIEQPLSSAIVDGVNRAGMVTLNEQGDRLYGKRGDNVIIVDLSKKEYLDSIELETGIRRIVVDNSNDLVYISHYNGITFLDTKNDIHRIFTKSLDVSEINYILVNNDLAKIYASEMRGGKILVLDSKTKDVINTILLENPVWMELYKEKNQVFVNQHDKNSIAVIDMESDEIIKTIPVAAINIAINEKRGQLYAAGNTLKVIDIDSYEVVADFPVIFFHPDGEFKCNASWVSSFNPLNEIYVSCGGSRSLIVSMSDISDKSTSEKSSSIQASSEKQITESTKTEIQEPIVSEIVPDPEPETVCGAGTVLKDGVCVVEEQQRGGGCLIATATYGSELALQVQQLREIRDNTLLETESGSTFMASFNQFYYSFSPEIADLERENPIFKEAVKIIITPLLSSLSLLNYVDIDSEAEVLGYGISLILLNVGMYFVAPAMIILAIYRKHKPQSMI